MAHCPVDTRPLTLRTYTSLTPTLPKKKVRSFYLPIWLTLILIMKISVDSTSINCSASNPTQKGGYLAVAMMGALWEGEHPSRWLTRILISTIPRARSLYTGWGLCSYLGLDYSKSPFSSVSGTWNYSNPTWHVLGPPEALCDWFLSYPPISTMELVSLFSIPNSPAFPRHA